MFLTSEEWQRVFTYAQDSGRISEWYKGRFISTRNTYYKRIIKMVKIKRHFSSLLFCIMFTTLLLTTHVNSSPGLNITVNTSYDTYWVMHRVDIYGNLTLDGNPVSDGLVALEVRDPSNNLPIVIRTLQTGTNLPPHDITVDQIITADEFWNIKDQFVRGEQMHFYVEINKTSPGQQLVKVTLSVYDATNVHLFVTYAEFTLLGPGSVAWLPNFQIPDWASTGTANVYVSTYSDWPSAGGIPVGPEKSKSFTINAPGGGGYSPPIISGTYSLSFVLSVKDETGQYTVYVSSSYQGEQATNSKTFLVKAPDANGDGYVSGWDLSFLSDAWMSQTGDPNYNPNVDFNEDGSVSGWDLSILSDCWMWGPT